MALADGALVFKKGFADGLRPDPVLTVSEWRTVIGSCPKEPAQNPADSTPIAPHTYAKFRTSWATTQQTASCSLSVHRLGHRGGQHQDRVSNQLFPGLVPQRCAHAGYGRAQQPDPMDPMIEECPRLREKVRDPKSRDSSGNSMLQKLTPAGCWFWLGRTAPPACDQCRPVPVCR